MAWTFNEQRISSYVKGTEHAIGANSLVVTPWDAIRIVWQIASLSTPGQRIDGIAHSLKTFSATNETVEKDVVIYRNNVENDTYKIEVSGWVLLDTTDKFFQLTAGQLVDFATASATTGQVKLVEILPWGTFGIFELTKQWS